MSYIDSGKSKSVIPPQIKEPSPNKMDRSHGSKSGKTESGKTVTVSKESSRLRPKPADTNSKLLAERSVRNLTPKVLPEGAEKVGLELKGRSIKPEVAERFMDRIEFDHLGRIVSVKDTKSLSTSDLLELKNSQIADLAKTNSASPRDTARIETEIMLDFSSQLSNAMKKADPEGRKIMQDLGNKFKAAWLSGKTDATTVAAMLANAATDLQKISPELAKSAKSLQKEAEAPKHNTQYHDNILGRRFETELVNIMVAKPAPSVLKAADSLGKLMHDAVVTSCPEGTLPGRLKQIQEKLLEDPRPWATEIPHLQAFLKDPTSDNFKTMMTKNGTGFDIIKQSYVGVKISLAVDAPWMVEANKNYNNVVVPARSQTPSVLGSTGVSMIPVALRDMRKIINSAEQQLKALKSPTAEQVAELSALGSARQPLNMLNGSTPPKDLQKAFMTIRSDLRKVNPKVANSAKTLADDIKLHMKKHKDERLPLIENGSNMLGKQVTTRGFGTALPHQIEVRSDAGNYDKWQDGLMVQSKVHMDVDAPTPFEAKGLAANRYFVNGASGSTNVMMHAISHLGPKDDPDFASDAFAGVMMFLTFDGGHSLSESTGVYRSLLPDDRAVNGADFAQVMESRREKLADHHADFVDLPSYFKSNDTALAVQAAVNESFDRIQKSFDQIHPRS